MTEEQLACACHMIVEDEGKDDLVIVVTLPAGSDYGIRFQHAAEDIELTLENTRCCVIDLAEYVVGEPPPPLGDQPGAKHLYLVGVVRGPKRGDILEDQYEQVKLNFFGECISILEAHGLKEDKESFT